MLSNMIAKFCADPPKIKMLQFLIFISKWEEGKDKENQIIKIAVIDNIKRRIFITNFKLLA